MNKKIKYLVLGVCTILIASTFTAAGGMLHGSDESEIVLVSLEREKDLSLLRSADVYVLERYPDRALIELSDKSEERLTSMGIHISNRLPARTQLSVKGQEFDIEEGMPEFSDEMTINGYPEGEKGLYLVHMLGPVHPEWIAELESMDVEIIDYVPNYAYELYITPEQAEKIEDLYFVDWIDIYQPGFKLAEDLELGKVSINYVDGSRSVKEIEDESSLFRIAKQSHVYYISNYLEPQLHGEVSSQTIGGGNWIWDPDGDPYQPWRGHNNEYDYGSHVNHLGYSGDEITVSVADTGIHPDHPDFQDRVIGGISYTGDDDWSDGHGHGTHCAGSVAADTYAGTGDTVDEHWETDVEDYYVAQGMAHESELFSVRIFDDRGAFVGPTSDYGEIITDARENSDSYIHSNSWGSESTGSYGDADSDYDSVVRDAGDGKPMVITISAGNAGSTGDDLGQGSPDYQTTGSPGNAKNAITVGASEAFYPGLAEDVDGYEGDPDRTAEFSSRGWTADNRVKPDVMAPGLYTFSTYIDDETGEWSYAGMGGTSMSNPAVAGASSLVVEWYEEKYGVRPSPAMVKALMINTAYDMKDRADDFYTGPIPNRDEGWGIVNLPRVMDPPVDLMLEDQTSVITTGEEQVYEIDPMSQEEPLKISLVWTDAPASSGASPSLRNDLNLEVESPSGSWFRGNGFPTDGDGFSTRSYTEPNTEAMSTFDGSGDGWDDRNNVQNVYIHPDELEDGTYTVRVIGENIPNPVEGDGQDYALVVYNEGEEERGPLPPDDPSPEDGATSVSRDPTLSVYVEHEEGESTNVSFYDASDDSLIGEEADVQNGSRATTTWNDLDHTSVYEWYAAADGVGSNIWNFTTEQASPLPPIDPDPGDDAGEVDTDPELSVYAEHEAGRSMDISFYDASDDSLIGSEEDIASGDRATTIWAGLELDTYYSWYVVADDGENTATSDDWSFTTEGYTLTIDVIGEGRTDPEVGTHVYEPGGEVALEAIEEVESHYFSQWTGDHPEGEAEKEEIILTMDEDKEITANFEIKEYDLAIETEGQGSTDPPEGTHTYEHGDDVPLTAIPDEGWYFMEWIGDHQSAQEDITITMDGDKSITARFEIKEYDLAIETEGQGSTDPLEGTHTYEHGDVVPLTATPDEGWYFVEWTGDHTGTEEQIEIIMDEDKDITALFEIHEYSLDISLEGGGVVDIDPDQTEYDHGTNVTLTAVPEEGWYFEEWIGIDETKDEIEIIMDGNKDITANFEELEPAYFEIEITEYGEEVKEGEEIIVKYVVKNIGELDGTQDIVIYLGGEEVDVYNDLNLAPGEDYQGEFTLDAQDVGEHEFKVTSDDTSSEVMVMVEQDDGFLSNYWWMLLLPLIGIIAAVVLIFVIKGKDGEEDKIDRPPPPPRPPSQQSGYESRTKDGGVDDMGQNTDDRF